MRAASPGRFAYHDLRCILMIRFCRRCATRTHGPHMSSAYAHVKVAENWSSSSGWLCLSSPRLGTDLDQQNQCCGPAVLVVPALPFTFCAVQWLFFFPDTALLPGFEGLPSSINYFSILSVCLLPTPSYSDIGSSWQKTEGREFSPQESSGLTQWTSWEGQGEMKNFSRGS